MRPVHPNLLKLLRRGDSSFRYIVEAHAVTRGDVKQTKAHWLAGDGPPTTADFEFVVDGGLRIAPTIANLVSSTTGSSFLTDLNNDYPYLVAHVSWGGTDDPNVEVMRVIANLHPNRLGTGREVIWWRCRLFAVSKVADVRGTGTGSPMLQLTPLSDPVDVQAAGDAAGDVTFDFSALATKPKPKSVPVQFGSPGVALTVHANFPEYAHPCTIVRIDALKADGSPALNVGWGYDNTIQTFGTGNVLRSKSLDNQYPAFGGFSAPVIPGEYADRGSAGGVPKISIQTGSFVAKTITFSSGNLLDLTAAPTGAVHLLGLAETPIGTSVTFRIRNDADTAYVDFTDGQTFADLSMTATQTRKCQVLLTPNAAGNVTPTLRRIGMEEKVIVDLSHVAHITRYKCHLDPITLEGRPTTATLRAVKNGVANFRSAIEDLLTTYDIASLEFRWYVGDTRLNRSQWTLIDSFPVLDDFEPDAAGVGIELFGANALVSSAVPKYDSSGSGLETPDSTTSIGSWTDQAGGTTNIHLTIDESVPDDTDYIRSNTSPSNSAYEAGLSNLADPNRDTGHYVDLRIKKDSTGGEVLTVVVELRQAAVVKMTTEATTVPDEWTDVSFALSAAQAQSISDYTDLRIRIIANVASGAGARRVYVSWAQLRVVGQRSALVYTNQAANAVYADLLSQAEVPGRFKGPDFPNTTVVSKTITQSNALDELRYLSAVFGYSVVSSRGALLAVDMFSARGIVASFPADRVQPLRIAPGFRERRWLVSVPWNWSNEKNRFEDEAIWASSVAKTKLGPGRFDAEERWNEESGKWIYTGSVAKGIATRTGNAIGTGLILWRFRALDHWPEIECGDRVSIGTTRFLAKDPHSTLAIRGHTTALASITDCSFTDGVWEFTGWVQGYADIMSVGGDSYNLSDTPSITNVEPAWRGDHLYVLWVGDAKVKSVKVATSTTAQPAAGTGTAAEGQTNEYDTGAFTYTSLVYITVTPYSQTGAGGIAGQPFYTTFRLPHIETLIDHTTGKVKRSSAFNLQGSLLTFVSPLAGTFFSYATGGPAAAQMWIGFSWTTQSLYLPDGTTATVPSPPAAPSAPTLGQTAGGALGARTRYAKVAYLKTDPITGHETLYPVSAESSFAISANNLLVVTALADPGNGLYSGWAVLVGSATGANYVQGAVAQQTFGVNWTEPAGGFSTTQNSLWTASWKSITKIGLDPSTTYKHYPYWDIALNFVYIPAETTNVNPQLAQLQNGDGVMSLGRYGTSEGFSGVVSLATPAAASTTSGTAGGGRLT